jgi:hypothetical protein
LINSEKGEAMEMISLIVDGNDYFVAVLDDLYVRIGMVVGECYTVPSGNRFYERIMDCTNEFDAENLLMKCMAYTNE